MTKVSIDTEFVPSPLIGALLRGPFEVVRKRMLDGLHERGFRDFVPAYHDVFQHPGPEGRRPGDLARNTGMSKQAMNYLIGQLERLGYLTREQDEEDQRSKRVRLTERGWAAVAAIREIVREVEIEWEELVGPERFAQLREVLELLDAEGAREG